MSSKTAEMKAVNILPEVYNKIMFWVDKCDKEISGFGKVIIKNGAYWVISAHLLEQEVSSTETEIDDIALAKLMADTIKEEGFLNYWWHSHVNMSTSWSSTDTDTIKELGGNGMCLATVFNKKRSTRTAFCQAGDSFLPSIFIDNLDLVISPMLDERANDSWEKEMNDKVKEKKFDLTEYQGGRRNMYAGSWGYEDDDDDLDDQGFFITNRNKLNRNDFLDLPNKKRKKWCKLYKLAYGYPATNHMDSQLIKFYSENRHGDLDALIINYTLNNNIHQ